MITIDMGDEHEPKRGDLVYTNVGKTRTRTWIVLRSRKVRSKEHAHRFQVWMARWWELEPEMRDRLFRSAERAGGQEVIVFDRYPTKKRHRQLPAIFQQHSITAPARSQQSASKHCE